MPLHLGKLRSFLIVGLVVAAFIMIVLSQLSQRTPSLPDGLIQANGRIEGNSVIVSSKQPGRIVEMEVREGDSIDSGKLLARLDDRVIRSHVDQAIAAAEAANARTEQCLADFDLLKKEVPLRIDSSNAGVDAAEAVLLQAEAEDTQTYRDYERFLKLGRDGYTSQEKTERAKTNWAQAKDQVSVARAAIIAANQDRNDANLGPDRLLSKNAQVLAFRAAEKEALARVDEAQAILEELTIYSPSAGTITTRFAEKGELMSLGTPLFELVNLDELHLKVFIPQVQIGKVRLGLPARIYTDAFPDEPFDAEVGYIASRAEFTPKDVQTPDERVKLVYAVKLYIKENSDHRLTPGLPADAMIQWMPEVPWTKPQW